MNRSKFIWLPALVSFFLLPLFPALPSQPERTESTHRPGYAGDASCLECHKSQSLSYAQTSHHFTSQMPTSTSVLGSFRDGANLLTIVDPAQNSVEPGLQFKMAAKADGFYETASTGWLPHLHQRTERIDLVTGSGVRGQTYLYWQGDQLLELPVSYWTDGHRWINSPGYVDGTAEFSRPVNPGCLECHMGYIRALSTDPNTSRYDRESAEPGISCESCHGPGANHVQQETRRSSTTMQPVDKGILNPIKFSRDRQIDLCAECHNGTQRESLRPAFSYLPGQPLNDFFKPFPQAALERPDVHGNQVGLLQRSKCYLSSPQMSCSTCHDVHATERPAASYSVKCLSCHQWQSCGIAKKMGHAIANNCIDCHMPVEPTNAIVSQTAGEMVRAKMRNHWIKVYASTSSANASRPRNVP